MAEGVSMASSMAFIIRLLPVALPPWTMIVERLHALRRVVSCRIWSSRQDGRLSKEKRRSLGSEDIVRSLVPQLENSLIPYSTRVGARVSSRNRG